MHHLQLSQDQQCLRGQYHRHTSVFKCAGAVSSCANDQSPLSPVSATHRLQSPATHRLQSPVSATHRLQSPVSLPDAVSLLLDNADLSHHHLDLQREIICARSVGLLGGEEFEELGLTQAEMTRFYAHRQQIADNSRDIAFGSCGDAHIGEASHPGPSVPYNTRRQTRPSMINIFMLTVACVISV